jgi:hypothetical protein
MTENIRTSTDLYNLDTPIPFTFFRDRAASEKHEAPVSLRKLAEQIRITVADSKAGLPWLKMATFGDVRSDHNALRHDPNVLAVTGIEVDYDGEVISVDEAVATLRGWGVTGLVYTSPSHSDTAPRWRVLCPLSAPSAPAVRAKMAARLNGLFEGALADESFTLSQAFYYGSVAGKPAPRVALIEGQPIDAFDLLDIFARGRPHANAGGGASTALDEDGLLDEIVTGNSYHESTIRLLGKYARSGVPYLDARAALLAAFDQVPLVDRDGRWKERRGDVDRCLDDIYGKAARQRDAQAPRTQFADVLAPEPVEPDDATAPEPAALEAVLDSSVWLNLDIPPPDKLLGDLFSTTTRMFLAGKTGLGKTMVSLGMAVAMATGTPFLRWTSERAARVLFIDGEMSTDLIKERLQDAVRRCGRPIPPGNLLIYGADRADEITKAHPTFTQMPPLNTPDGHAWILGLIDAAGGRGRRVDAVIFDNVMSLLKGDQKDEETWTAASPLVMALTARKIGQIWVDHTGHNTERLYGSSTKPWRFDVSGIMKPHGDDPDNAKELTFELSFDKARRRKPSNWVQFAKCVVRLEDDVWTTENVATSKTKLTPKYQIIADHVADMLDAKGGESVSFSGLREACLEDHRISAVESRPSRRREFNRHYQDALARDLLHSEGEQVFLGARQGLSHGFPVEPIDNVEDVNAILH